MLFFPPYYCYFPFGLFPLLCPAFITDVTYRPASRAGTVSSDVVARSSILTGAALLTVGPMTTGGAALSTAVTTDKSQTFLAHALCSPEVICINKNAQTINSDKVESVKLLLTTPPSTPVHRCTLPFHGCRWHYWDTGRGVGTPFHSNPVHRAPHNAIPGSRQCRHRHLWWGYTLPRFGTGSDCCNEVPSSHSRSLQAQREVASDGAKANIQRQLSLKQFSEIRESTRRWMVNVPGMSAHSHYIALWNDSCGDS